MEIIHANREQSLAEELARKQVSRRSFLRSAGIVTVSATAIGAIAGCKKDTDQDSNGSINLGSGDVGILNYAYALEQLEAAFYKQVTDMPFSGMTSIEAGYFADIRDHEIAHREFFKSALGSNAIQSLEVDFSAINFSSRDSILATAKAFEDLGVAAYNGAGKLLTDGNNLLIAGKIVSVEARHAALIRDLIQANSFAGSDAVDNNGMDKASTPGEVLSIAGTYIKSKLNASNLPS